MQTRLAMMLVQAGLATREEIENIAAEWGPGEVELAEALVLRGQVTEELITEFLADIYSVEPVYLNETVLPDDAAGIIPEDTAREHLAVPLERDGNTVSVAMAQPVNMYAVDELKFATGCEIVVYASSPSAVRRALDEVYGRRDSLVTVESTLNDYDEHRDGVVEVATLDPGVDEDDVTDDSLITDKEEPIVRFVDKMIANAVKSECSDIHIEPYEKFLRIRYRKDGTCHEVTKLSKAVQPSILSRLKIMSSMNIAERRKAQDGRIKAKVDNRIIDFRVSAVPTVNGEKIVLRILDRGNLEFDLRQLGFPEDALKSFMAGVNAPFGIVLVTGPTGSGKTTTLYSALSSLNVPGVNIHTAEDPVEYHIDGIVQTQIDHAMGYTFAAALRSLLRQDPNIIMVGEIRDLETASIAMKAALTGHLVFSTIHTNDAPGTINRLVDIGIKPFLVASAVRTIMAQRLVKKICNYCREPFTFQESDYIGAGIDPVVMAGARTYRGKGCGRCNGTGYKGRIGLYEVLTLDKEMKQAVIDRETAGRLRLLAVQNGMRTLRMDAVEKLKNGITTLEEVTRVTADDDEEVKVAAMNYSLESQIRAVSS